MREREGESNRDARRANARMNLKNRTKIVIPAIYAIYGIVGIQ